MSTASISDAIRKVSDVFRAEPEKAHSKGVPATARLVEGLRFEVTGTSGEKVVTDMPAALGGAGNAQAPGWLLRAAIASCTATVAAMRAAQTGVDLNTLEVTVESEADQRGLLGTDENVSAAFSALRVRVRIGADGVAPDDLRALATWGDAHSPVACTVRKSPAAAIEVKIV
ncbi:MAG TPA: OsmC family protein [Thermoleophilia bacterium]|nr:OsmC family protein [Thermoleophilia bacterium]